ncbi:MAG: cytochrome b6-f complex subunit 7 [Synechococcaceae cyanobacterium SM2_3_1]|nr:cytochrome b6-f complex subunit 7 [Synechococcaceae cyanobacterium SM2_3_1]
MASEIFSTAGLAMVLTLVGLAVGYAILKVTNANE